MRSRILFLLAALAASGCVDNRSSVEILGRAFPDALDTCLYKSGGDFLLGPGIFDVTTAGATPVYETVLYVHNSMADPSSTGNGATPSGKAWRATAARIRVNPTDYTSKFAPSPALIAVQGEARVPLDGMTIDPDGSSVVALHVIPVAVGTQIQAALVGALQYMVVGVTLEGITLDGAKVDSGEFYFGIDVCAGCLAGIVCPVGKTYQFCNHPWQDPAGCK